LLLFTSLSVVGSSSLKRFCPWDDFGQLTNLFTVNWVGDGVLVESDDDVGRPNFEVTGDTGAAIALLGRWDGFTRGMGVGIVGCRFMLAARDEREWYGATPAGGRPIFRLVSVLQKTD